jgi:hypothetical protein
MVSGTATQVTTWVGTVLLIVLLLRIGRALLAGIVMVAVIAVILVARLGITPDLPRLGW